ncbi:MAG: hypothetical protein V7695_05870 [Sulfitobacter sp.]
MRKSKIVIGVAVVAIGLGYVFQDTIQTRMYAFMHSSMHDRHSADGMGHDMKNMPGLRGANASESESDELAVMFENFETISREVTNLPNGIRTVTRSSDEDVMAVLVSHIVGMVDRVARGDDPKIFIQSPTLDILFANGAEMQSQIDVTEEGIVVVRTSTDPDVVAALHEHAAEVSDMADRGMQAVHDAMAQRADN